MSHMHQHLYTSRINEVQWSCQIYHKIKNLPTDHDQFLVGWVMCTFSASRPTCTPTWMALGWVSVGALWHTRTCQHLHIRTCIHTHSHQQSTQNKTYWMWLLKFVCEDYVDMYILCSLCLWYEVCANLAHLFCGFIMFAEENVEKNYMHFLHNILAMQIALHIDLTLWHNLITPKIHWI